MKKLFVFLLLVAASTSLSAQTRTRGLALGADRDTVKFLIASPFDNWHVNFSAGIQTFIGNAPDPEARWNSADWSIQAEIGKWIIPDFSIALRVGLSSVHSQSRHGGNNPFTDISNPINYADAEYNPYFPIKAHLFTVMGIVSIDWTNFFYGYETGKRQKWHICTPVGLGLACLFGSIDNPNYVTRMNNGNPDDEPIALGDMSKNLELGFTGGLLTEYYANKNFSFNAALELFFARGSIDDYNYNLDADIRRVDFIPSFHIGMRYNILSHMTKYQPYSRTSYRDTIYHEFQPAISTNTVKILNGRIEELQRERDGLISELDDSHNMDDMNTIDSINRELQRLQDLLDDYTNNPDANNPANPNYNPFYDPNYRPNTLIDELLDMNEALNLPCTVVYFELDKYNLDYNARLRLQSFASKVHKLSDTIEFYMIGAADSLTGSIPHNQWLSERRCEAAYNMLTHNFNLSGNQLIQVYAGGINDYTPQEHNRMVLIIQRTPVTEEIVERWLRMSRERLQQDKKRR